MSVYDADAFEERVNFAASYMLKGRATTRHFDTCFEMSDATVVCEALRRRAEKNPKLAAVVPRYLAPHAFPEAKEQYGHLKRGELAAAARAERELAQYYRLQRRTA